MRSLFIINKYYDGGPDQGLSPLMSNIVGSLKHTSFECEFVYYDECYYLKKNLQYEIDEAVGRLDPEVIFVFPMYSKIFNPPHILIKHLSKYCKVVYMYADAASTWAKDHMTEVESFTEKFITWDTYEGLPPITRGRVIFSYTPQDISLYKLDQPTVRDIPVSFLGSMHNPKRKELLKEIRTAGIEVFTTEGQHLPIDQYIDILRRSLITVNTTYSAFGPVQLKGRPFEAALAGALMVENTPSLTPMFFNANGIRHQGILPAQDIPWNIRKFLKDPGQLASLARLTHQRAKVILEPQGYWTDVFRAINGERQNWLLLY